MNALRIFYNETGGIIGNCGLEGPGIFPYSIEVMLEGYPEGTQCLEIDNSATVDLFFHSEGSYVEDGVLVLGTPIEIPISPPPEPPQSAHISILIAVDVSKARPANVKRVWGSQDYFYDCFVTQTVKDEFVAGTIQIGDYLLVHYDDMGEQLVTAKVFKSW